MKKTNCLICKKAKFKKVIDSQLLKVFECLNCGLYRVPQKKKNIRSIDQYFKNYDLEKYISYYKKFRKEIYRENWKDIKRWKKEGNSLDYGSSFGWFLEIAPKKWKAYGVEPADIANDSKKMGLKVKQGTEKAAAEFNKKFDLVTMWNVIEHLNDPIQTLNKLAKLMTDNSILSIAFPNRNGFYNGVAYFLYFVSFGKITKPLYVLFQADNPVPHLYHFRTLDINKICKITGFEILEVKAQRIIDAKSLFKREEVHSNFVLKFIVVPTLIVVDKLVSFLNLNNDEIVIYAKKVKK